MSSSARYRHMTGGLLRKRARPRRDVPQLVQQLLDHMQRGMSVETALGKLLRAPSSRWTLNESRTAFSVTAAALAESIPLSVYQHDLQKVADFAAHRIESSCVATSCSSSACLNANPISRQRATPAIPFLTQRVGTSDKPQRENTPWRHWVRIHSGDAELLVLRGVAARSRMLSQMLKVAKAAGEYLPFIPPATTIETFIHTQKLYARRSY